MQSTKSQLIIMHTTYYSTSDLSLASALITSEFEMISLKRQNGKWCFYFEASHRLSGFVENYFLGKTLVDPIKFSQTQKALKNYLFNS